MKSNSQIAQSLFKLHLVEISFFNALKFILLLKVFFFLHLHAIVIRLHQKYSLLLPNGMFGTKYSRMDQGKFFKGSLPQLWLGPFLNTLSHLQINFRGDGLDQHSVSVWVLSWIFPANIYLLKIKNKNTRKRFDILTSF